MKKSTFTRLLRTSIAGATILSPFFPASGLVQAKEIAGYEVKTLVKTNCDKGDAAQCSSTNKPANCATSQAGECTREGDSQYVVVGGAFRSGLKVQGEVVFDNPNLLNAEHIQFVTALNGDPIKKIVSECNASLKKSCPASSECANQENCSDELCTADECNQKPKCDQSQKPCDEKNSAAVNCSKENAIAEVCSQNAKVKVPCQSSPVEQFDVTQAASAELMSTGNESQSLFIAELINDAGACENKTCPTNCPETHAEDALEEPAPLAGVEIPVPVEEYISLLVERAELKAKLELTEQLMEERVASLKQIHSLVERNSLLSSQAAVAEVKQQLAESIAASLIAKAETQTSTDSSMDESLSQAIQYGKQQLELLKSQLSNLKSKTPVPFAKTELGLRAKPYTPTAHLYRLNKDTIEMAPIADEVEKK